MESSTVGAEDSEYFLVFWQKEGGKLLKNQHLKSVMKLFTVKLNAIKRTIWHLLTDEGNLALKEVKNKYEDHC